MALRLGLGLLAAMAVAPAWAAPESDMAAPAPSTPALVLQPSLPPAPRKARIVPMRPMPTTEPAGPVDFSVPAPSLPPTVMADAPLKPAAKVKATRTPPPPKAKLAEIVKPAPPEPAPVAPAAPAAIAEPAPAKVVQAVAPPAPTPPVKPASIVPPPPSEAQQYCASIGASAIDAQAAWQASRLIELDQQLKTRIAELEAKRVEYKDWLAKREEALRKAEDGLVQIYSRMRPDAAALQLSAMEDGTAAAVLTKLNSRSASAILNEMEAGRAARLTGAMAGIANAVRDGKKT